MIRQTTLALALLALFCFVGTLAAGGCNTTKGFGQDLQSGGENLEHQAEKSGARND
jgi:predicted small secreted protein